MEFLKLGEFFERALPSEHIEVAGAAVGESCDLHISLRDAGVQRRYLASDELTAVDNDLLIEGARIGECLDNCAGERDAGLAIKRFQPVTVGEPSATTVSR